MLLPPPSGGDGRESRETTPRTPDAPAAAAWGAGSTSPGEISPSLSRRFFSGIAPTGDFDEEAARYEAVCAMLSGDTNPGFGIDTFYDLRERPPKLTRDEKAFSGKNPDATDPIRATDPALVLETRSVTLSRGFRVWEPRRPRRPRRPEKRGRRRVRARARGLASAFESRRQARRARALGARRLGAAATASDTPGHSRVVAREAGEGGGRGSRRAGARPRPGDVRNGDVRNGDVRNGDV